MNKPTIVLVGAGIGAAAMYIADPASGRRRRGRIRDLAVHTSKVVQTATGASSRDFEHRLAGLAARSRWWIGHEAPPLDDVLVARVRARVGRLVAHPAAIEVHASKGVVALSGTVSETEARHLLAGVGKIHGVLAVEDRLERRAEEAGVSAPKRIRWSPAIRFIAGVAGLMLTALASREETAET
jgi:hypothetical protein